MIDHVGDGGKLLGCDVVRAAVLGSPDPDPRFWFSSNPRCQGECALAKYTEVSTASLNPGVGNRSHCFDVAIVRPPAGFRTRLVGNVRSLDLPVRLVRRDERTR